MKNKLTINHELSWVDYIRVAACLLVVLAHCCDPFVSSSSSEAFMAGSIWGTFYRPAVPLFIMISGVLLLPTNLRIGEFYSRRLKRILKPFIFWSIVSPLLFYAFAHAFDVLNPAFNPEHHTLTAMLNNLWLWIFSFNFSTIPYWYIYMMIGVYLIIPIISSWVKEATKKELELVLKIWFFTTFIQYIEIILPSLGYTGNYGHFGIYGDCSWNTFSVFHYLSGFLGYALLGHYLKKYPRTWSMTKTVTLCAVMWVVGYAISFGGFHFVKINFPDNFNMLEIPWMYTSFNVVLMTLPFFLLIQRLNPKPRKLITLISDYSFGIFLAHFIVVHLSYEFVIRYISIPPFLQLFVAFVIGFVLTTLLVAMLRKIPFIRRFV